MSDDDDDVPKLSEATMAALQEFLKEQAEEEEEIKENWKLSQFWYNKKTIQHLSESALQLAGNNSSIALISCPSLYATIKFKRDEMGRKVDVKLFEFDQSFRCFEPDFVPYDYRKPLRLELKYEKYFDVVLADPPYLSDECLSKVAQTIQCIGKENCKIVLCTGAVMENLAGELLNLKLCNFQPKHQKNLANEFVCFTNCGEI